MPRLVAKRTALGALLRDARERRGLTLRDVHGALGIQAPTLSRWEQSAQKITPTLLEVADHLGISEVELVRAVRAASNGRKGARR